MLPNGQVTQISTVVQIVYIESYPNGPSILMQRTGDGQYRIKHNVKSLEVERQPALQVVATADHR
uniref:Uncharacterized protein n=1 Tax=Romanomermis culicivorax TaxID=13658 RepID=A0A915JHM1_ROMCU